MVELKIRRLALPPPVLLCSLDSCTALQSKVRDGEVGRSNVALKKGLQVPVELDLDGQEHVDHQVEQEPALQDLMRRK